MLVLTFSGSTHFVEKQILQCILHVDIVFVLFTVIEEENDQVEETETKKEV